VGIVNAFFTVCKLIPLVLVIVFGGLAFSPGIFSVENWQSTLASTAGPASVTTLGAQINAAMGVILWCFVGVEASTILAEKAKSQKLVGKATVISLLITLSVYALVSLLSMGVVPATELVDARTPLADVLSNTIIGSAGAMIVKLGIITSVLGALVSWILLLAQVFTVAAKDGVMPKLLAKESEKGVPVNSIIITSVATQLCLLVLLSDKLQGVYNTVILLAATTIIIPYVLSGIYSLIVCKQDQLGPKEYFISIIATIYAIYCLFAVGIMFLAVSFVFYGVGMFVFILAKKEKNQKLTKAEKIGVVFTLGLGILMAILLATGVIAF